MTAFWEHAGSEKHGRRTRRRKGESEQEKKESEQLCLKAPLETAVCNTIDYVSFQLFWRNYWQLVAAVHRKATGFV